MNKNFLEAFNIKNLLSECYILKEIQMKKYLK